MTKNTWGTTWTKEEDARLRKLHAAGTSQRKIGEALGRTKNEVSGRVRRLGMADSSRSPIKRLTAEEKVQRKAAQPKKPRPPKPVLVRAPRPSDGIWRPKTCQFPEGTPGTPDFHFCGAKLEPADGRSYCPEYYARCYLSPKKREGDDGPAAEFQWKGWGGRGT